MARIRSLNACKILLILARDDFGFAGHIAEELGVHYQTVIGELRKLRKAGVVQAHFASFASYQKIYSLVPTNGLAMYALYECKHSKLLEHKKTKSTSRR